MSTKTKFFNHAKAKGMNVSYSGNANTMFVKGQPAKVDGFIKSLNFIGGKKAFNFQIAQG